MPTWPRALSLELAAGYVGLSTTTLLREVTEGRAPAPIYLTERRKVWLREHLDGWLDRVAGTVPASGDDNPWH